MQNFLKNNQSQIYKEQIKNKIEELLDNYELIINIAVKMDTKNIKIIYEDWFKEYPCGIIISELEFKAEYIKNNIRECFVKSILFDFAFSEEWSYDFFDIPELERCKLMKSKFYKGIFTYPEKRMRFSDYNEFIKDFIYFTTNNGMSSEKQQYYLNYFKEAVIIEIGGSYALDYVYYIISNEKVFVISYGIWD